MSGVEAGFRSDPSCRGITMAWRVHTHSNACAPSNGATSSVAADAICIASRLTTNSSRLEQTPVCVPIRMRVALLVSICAAVCFGRVPNFPFDGGPCDSDWDCSLAGVCTAASASAILASRLDTSRRTFGLLRVRFSGTYWGRPKRRMGQRAPRTAGQGNW